MTVVAAPVERVVERIDDDDDDVVAIGLVQSATGLPVDARLSVACVADTYKWLMTPRGATFGYLSPQLQELVRPVQSGWSAAVDDRYYGLEARLFQEARRYDQAPTWFTHVAAAPTLDLVEAIGVEGINRHDVGLANACRAG